MFPLLTGLISGGASLLGSLFSSSTSASNTQQQLQAQQAMQQQSQTFNAEEAQKAREFNSAEAGVSRDFSAAQADTQRQFQLQMSNTAFQRGKQDAMAAGLNPMVLAGMGGASTPSGAMAQSSQASGPSASIGTPSVPMPQTRHALADLGDAVNKAVSSAIQVKTFERMTDEIANLQATNQKIKAETLTEEARKTLVSAQSRTEQKRPENIAQQTTAMKLDRARQEWEAIKYLDLSNIPDVARKAGNIGSWGAGKVEDLMSPLLNSAKAYKMLSPSRSTTTRERSFGKGFESTWEERIGH